jgi:pantothenate kinase
VALSEVPTVVLDDRGDPLIQRVRSLTGDGRVILGICGPPGAGKSTLAAWLATIFTATTARLVPMDGFHLSNAALRAQGLADRKGARETFDADGYAALLTRIRQADEPVVYAPDYDRSHDEPIAAVVAVEREVPLVLTEGNYLLADGPGWTRARRQMDEVWFVDVDPDLRRRRLVERHVRFGKTPDAARRWVDAVDEVNAGLIADSRERADLVVRLGADLALPAAGG